MIFSIRFVAIERGQEQAELQWPQPEQFNQFVQVLLAEGASVSDHVQILEVGEGPPERGCYTPGVALFERQGRSVALPGASPVLESS